DPVWNRRSICIKVCGCPATAAAAQADAIVTRDKNVLSISSYGKIQILNETQAMELITGKHETIP
ncbi:MAG: hypothetical protein OXS28_21885, partial [Gammaproteobacteria bacterium]|nr:hypothetical protein [Gammaproteobacteria bacterium]